MREETPGWVKNAKPGDKVVCIFLVDQGLPTDLIEGQVYTIYDIKEITARVGNSQVEKTAVAIRLIGKLIDPLDNSQVWYPPAALKPVEEQKKLTDISVFADILKSKTKQLEEV